MGMYGAIHRVSADALQRVAEAGALDDLAGAATATVDVDKRWMVVGLALGTLAGRPQSVPFLQGGVPLPSWQHDAELRRRFAGVTTTDALGPDDHATASELFDLDNGATMRIPPVEVQRLAMALAASSWTLDDAVDGGVEASEYPMIPADDPYWRDECRATVDEAIALVSAAAVAGDALVWRVEV